MKVMKFIVPLAFFIIFTMVSIFLTGSALYLFGEVFFYFYKGIPMSFSLDMFLLLIKITVYVGCFAGFMLWISNLLKK